MFQKKGRWLFRLWILKTTWVIGWSSGAQRELDRWETSTSNFEKLDIWQGSCLAQDFLQTVRFTQRITQGIVSASETLCSVQFSRSVVSDSLRPHKLKHSRPPRPSPTPRVHSDSRPSSWWCHPTISSSVVPFSCPNPSQHQSLFQWVNSSHKVAKVLEFQLQHQSFQRTPRTDLL